MCVRPRETVRLKQGSWSAGSTYAAVLAIWPKRPGPWLGGAAAGGAICCWGAAMVAAGRDCWEAGAAGLEATVGREGAERPAGLEERGIVNVRCGVV